MIDTSQQRKNMVESQVRPSDVTDRRITAAMLVLPRENFVPAALADLAYIDETLGFGRDRFMIAPRALAKIIQLAEIDAGDKVLVISSGSAYAAAVVANLAESVIALLPDPERANASADVLSSLGIANVACESGVLRDGWRASALYDAIVIEGGVELVPAALQKQLAKNGRLVAIQRRKGIGRALVMQNVGDVIDQRATFELAAPLLEGFEAEHTPFVF